MLVPQISRRDCITYINIVVSIKCQHSLLRRQLSGQAENRGSSCRSSSQNSEAGDDLSNYTCVDFDLI